MAEFVYAPPDEVPEPLFLDGSVLVVNKPAGLLSVPGRLPEHKDCLVARLTKVHGPTLTVHRLDMDTSGVMVFARTKTAQAHLSRQFEMRKVGKIYQALVHGSLKEESGRVDLPLMVDWPNRPKQKVDHANGKPAQTHWRVLEDRKDATLLELTPVTGRSHQLRVHMAALGHPIIGDRFYGDTTKPEAADRLMLHAQELVFEHPETSEKMVFSKKSEF